jgi:hypothetical protein
VSRLGRDVAVTIVQRLVVRRADVPETASEHVAAGSDGLGKVAVDDHRIGVRGDVALFESATGEARHFVDIEERGLDMVEPGEESWQLAVEYLGRRVAALNVDEHPGLLAGWTQGCRHAEDARVGHQPSRQLALAMAEELGALSPRVLRLAGCLPWRLVRVHHERAPFERDARGRKFLGGEARADDAGPAKCPRRARRQWQHADEKRICAVESPVKALAPASNSSRSAPKLNTSERASSGLPAACSGDM